MIHGDKVHIGELRVGDVVRLLNGPNPQGGGVVGGPSDFREGYDVATVTEVTDKMVTFERPYLYIGQRNDPPGAVRHKLRRSGVEKWEVHRDHGGLYYEKLEIPCEWDRERFPSTLRTVFNHVEARIRKTVAEAEPLNHGDLRLISEILGELADEIEQESKKAMQRDLRKEGAVK